MMPRLASGLVLILGLSICLQAAAKTTSGSRSSSNTDDYHYPDEYDDDDDDDYDYNYNYQDQNPKAIADSDKLSSTSSTTSTTTTTTSEAPPVNSKTTADPLWSNEDAAIEIFACPQECSCEDGTQFLNCSQRKLIEIPRDLPHDVIRLDLSRNNIKQIPVDAFQNCTDVREIMLDRNVIEEIDKEVFAGLIRLDLLGLQGNQIAHLTPDTFVGAQSLRRLVLNENPLIVPDDGPLLIQEELEELELARCNFTELNHQTFGGLDGLKSLNLAGNEFDEDLSTDVFEPLVNLQRLHLPPLSEDTVRDLCDVIKSIDVVDITTHNISCFYLASETSYEESIITQRPIAPEPKTKDPDQDDASSTAKPEKKAITVEKESEPPLVNELQSTTESTTQLTSRKTTSTSTTTTVTTKAPPTVSGPSSASITHSTAEDDVKKESTPEAAAPSMLAAISSETMKHLLMGIIGAGVLILMAGIVCRRTGLKNKFCGSKRRPAPTDQVRPAEEVPLNKV
ncbi:uncharacterized protein LOC131439039 [Malaya genurostris]|uniref:uncharacterized protein LOC131439039 n=1 Tax=Malaya genurostris TaxID=325434 RepID=UPI0026F3E5EA|nr:uncharacterized protein LOC131439039 [Malaya genurostris]XP_058465540.1 uncharacterized protein LOC131439039 [Malaya genurostris]